MIAKPCIHGSRTRTNCRECRRTYDKSWKEEYRKKLFAEVLAAYGGKCANPTCGDDRPEVLTIDHVGLNGHEHRREIKRNGGYGFYIWLRQRGFPQENFRLLCFNCNCCLGFRGKLPSPPPWRTEYEAVG